MSSINLEDIIEKFKEIDDKLSKYEKIEYIFITGKVAFQGTKDGFKITSNNKKYLVFNKDAWNNILDYFKNNNLLYEDEIIDFSGIPVIEDDKLLQEILEELANEYLEKYKENLFMPKFENEFSFDYSKCFRYDIPKIKDTNWKNLISL